MRTVVTHTSGPSGRTLSTTVTGSQPMITWQHSPAPDTMSDPEFRLIANGRETGIYVQDARAYGGGLCVNREAGEGDDFSIFHHGEYRDLPTAKAAAVRVFRNGR